MIPDSVTTINPYAFETCTALESIVIGESVTYIGYSAFESCTKLTSIVIPDSVTTIDMIAFDDCTSLESIVIGDSVTFIGDNSFWKSKSLTSIVIPSSVTNIGIFAFSYCTNLTSIVIPDSVTINNNAFYNCPALDNVFQYNTSEQKFYGASILNNKQVQVNSPSTEYTFNELIGLSHFNEDVLVDVYCGCTNPIASNYDENALIDDESCIITKNSIDSSNNDDIVTLPDAIVTYSTIINKNDYIILY